MSLFGAGAIIIGAVRGATVLQNGTVVGSSGSGDPYRPSQWDFQGRNATLSLLVPVGSTGTVQDTQGSATTLYVFDAVISSEHEQELVLTSNPVQTGASLTDHAYLLPARVTCDIRMSDSMQSYVMGQFSGDVSRSVAAYQQLLQIQRSRTLFGLSTRLRSYSNMAIVSVRASETAETRYGGKFSVTFQEVLLATVELSHSTMTPDTGGDSERPQSTDISVSGSTLTQPVPQTLSEQHAVSGSPSGANVPGAGLWTSGNVGTLPDEGGS